jgi:hypothetical protein
VRKRIVVGGRRYRVVLNCNERGEWYANAHGRGDVMPAAFVSGHTTEAEALAAVRSALTASA